MMQKQITKHSRITLREVTKETVVDVCRLSPKEEQKQFVASNAQSIAEAHFEPDYAWLRAIYAEDTPVGFVMLGIDPRESFAFLWRFMIDKKYQTLGFGRKALKLVLHHLRSQTNVCRVVTSYHQGQGDPSGFYKKLGFEEVDDQEDWGDLGREMIALGETRLELKKLSCL